MLVPPSITEIHRPATQEKGIQNATHAIRAIREQSTRSTLADFSVFFQLLMTYRTPMMIDIHCVFLISSKPQKKSGWTVFGEPF